MNEKEYIDKYCKYCANRDEDDMCNIVRDIDGNVKCENYKTYYSMDISDLLLKIGRQEGKIEYLDQEEERLKKYLMEEEVMSADKMFEKLGYKKEKYYDEIFYYKVNGMGNKVGFEFWLDYKEVYPVLHEGNDDVALDFNLKELQAINQKCKELGWI